MAVQEDTSSPWSETSIGTQCSSSFHLSSVRGETGSVVDFVQMDTFRVRVGDRSRPIGITQINFLLR
ncbi:hypothetical protein BDA96_01G508000 [Sorghum bicolor]|uniref:Uncharacterized protein n=1 Tax=Sorghum bicolor TaxID=4558 RepID=A0A921V1R5_SORBI|nr:hypothetical protein BDA96_01G508000 [Sorghum bicolor]